jgi:chemotaxis signal transduction protein
MLKTKTKIATTKILTFSVGSLFLAVQLDAVEKVIRLPEVLSSGQTPLGVTQFGDAELMVLDLHQKIYNRPNPSQIKYIIILKTDRQGNFGIPVSGLPEISDVVQSEIRPLPETYRQEDTLGIASHVVTINRKEEILTAFLIPPVSLLSLFQSAHLASA